MVSGFCSRSASKTFIGIYTSVLRQCLMKDGCASSQDGRVFGCLIKDGSGSGQDRAVFECSNKDGGYF